MSEAGSNRFTRYFPVLLDALRSSDPTPMRPAAARAWIRSRIEVAPEDLTRLIKAKSKQTIFDNDVHWARFYLYKAGLVSAPKRGYWGLTQTGRDTHLTPENTWALYVTIRDAHRKGATQDEQDLPAPELENADEGVVHWFAGATWDKDDQLERFLSQGVWENGQSEDQFTPLVRRIKPGDKIAIKSTFVQRLRLPFDAGGKSVSVMRIKAIGTVVENVGDGRRVKVDWDREFERRDWYFYTYRTTLVEVDMEREDGRRLVEFAFAGEPQDYRWFLEQPYWAQKYGVPEQHPPDASTEELTDYLAEDPIEAEDAPLYTVENIIAEGCFLPSEKLTEILARWKKKKNLILQGPPGTGKTWLAKRLGFALVGSNDRETAKSRLRVVQFHPSLSYEDFVRGWRPAGEGRLALVDGILIQAINSAASEPDRPFVLVIEEINRGNPSQIFGEMLTLLEDSKRQPSEAVELAYKRDPDERVHIPANLHVIGTMNIADRSLAMVDLALRRRFAFVDLEPTFGRVWSDWCSKRGIDGEMLMQIESRIVALNAEISSSASLGRQFQIGHSYVTPGDDETVGDGLSWFRAKVETEIGPLLDEYWYDNPEKAQELEAKLLAGLD